jgi:hypothetical protein
MDYEIVQLGHDIVGPVANQEQKYARKVDVYGPKLSGQS